MKLTKKHLKQLIKEELENVLNEAEDPGWRGPAGRGWPGGADPAAQELKDRIAAHRGDEPKRARSGQEVADELESGAPDRGTRDPWDGIEGNAEMIADNALKIEYLARAAGVEIPIDLSSPRGPKG